MAGKQENGGRYKAAPGAAEREEIHQARLARVKRERSKLARVLADMPKAQKAIAGKLIENVAFMAVTLEDLQAYLNEHGPTSEYQNGENQWGTKKAPEVEVYNTMLKNYQSAVRQLCDMIPGKAVVDPDDKMLNWLKKSSR